MKHLATFILIIAGVSLIAAEQATIVTTLPDGKTESKTIEMKNMGENVFRVHIPVSEIPRDCISIDVQADMASAQKGEGGYFLLPDGSSGSFKEDEGFIGGKNCNARPRALTAMFGMKNPRGTFVAIVKGLRLEWSPYVTVKNGNYKIFPRFHIKGIEFLPYEDIIVDFHKFDSPDAGYVEMAKTYRKYQAENSGIVPLRERIKNNPTLAFTADSIFVRIKLGRFDRRNATKEQWEAGNLPLVVDHDFNGAMDIMWRMKSLGINAAEICFVGWHKDGHDGPFPDYFPIPQEFGGEKKMIEAIKYGKDLGYQMTTHVNHHNAYMRAERWNLADVSKDSEGNPRKYTVWPGGWAYNTCFEVMCNYYVDADFKKFKEMGLNGTQHVDVTTARLPAPCKDPMHPSNRKQQTEAQSKIAEKCKEYFGGFSSEAGFDHFAKNLDYALYILWMPLKNKLIERVYPTWQITYNGYILSNPFYSTIDSAYYKQPSESLSDAGEPYRYLDSTENRRLKVVEFGGRPTFYYVDYKDLEPMKSQYEQYQKLKRLQFEFMEDHKEIADNVFVTKYSDGTKVYCNYRDFPFTYGDKIVPAKGFAIVE